MTWHALSFVHWAVDPEVLRPHLPPELPLDVFGGLAYVGVVPFGIQRFRPVGAPVGLSFGEVNVRTYVRPDGIPGVWFFSLDAQSWAAVVGARVTYGLPYHHASVQVGHSAGDTVTYHARRDGAVRLIATTTVGAALGPAAPGTLEHFLVERYHLFAAGGRWAQVQHAPYRLHAATVDLHEESLRAAVDLPDGGARVPDLFCARLDVNLGPPRWKAQAESRASARSG